MKSFLICPVRGVDQDKTRHIVENLEKDGYDVHWPPRDTDQNDNIGLRICKDNKQAIIDADVVHMIWDGNSQGCLFDLGMAFALNKKIIPLSLPGKSNEKSFQNMVQAYSEIQ